MDLPEIFIKRMKSLMCEEEFNLFIKSYENPSLRGLRVNLLKYNEGATVLKQLPFLTTPVPWCKEGFIFENENRPAKSIAYQAGLFYIQEPSAMCPAEVLGVTPGQRVLDICAAPGGKSVQIAGKMRGKGTLISNDLSPTRCRALSKNLERAGVTNVIVLSSEPKKLAERFPLFFDRILVDAPCSGEGMFRRDEDLIKAYSKSKPEACVLMQKEILFFAAKMLSPGGQLVYSTCTFNPYENEEIISYFLEMNDDFELLPINHEALGISEGRAGWVASPFDLKNTARIWPHKATGEGHFIALLGKKDEANNKTTFRTADFNSKEFNEFCKTYLNFSISRGNFAAHGDSLYLQSEKIDLTGIRVSKNGWHLGEIKKGGFVPSQALAMGVKKTDVKYSIDLNEQDARAYLRGDSLESKMDIKIQKPWVLVTYLNNPLGWARLVQGRLKNHLPKGWVQS